MQDQTKQHKHIQSVLEKTTTLPPIPFAPCRLCQHLKNAMLKKRVSSNLFRHASPFFVTTPTQNDSQEFSNFIPYTLPMIRAML